MGLSTTSRRVFTVLMLTAEGKYKNENDLLEDIVPWHSILSVIVIEDVVNEAIVSDTNDSPVIEPSNRALMELKRK